VLNWQEELKPRAPTHLSRKFQPARARGRCRDIFHPSRSTGFQDDNEAGSAGSLDDLKKDGPDRKEW
jgi:hypothetical protein